MRPRRLLCTAAAGLALGLAALASSAMASDGPPMPPSGANAPSSEARARWLNECSERLTESGSAGRYDHLDRRQRRESRGRDRAQARASCERYYDSYYDYYSGHYRAWQPGAQSIQYQPRRARAEGCDPSPDCRCDCGEVVEYEYVDVPVRAAPRRVPDKRVRTVPDKRVRLK
jgi:hypothetical protein